jgi:hypothetical protein
MNHKQRLALLGGAMVAAATAYACSGDDTSTAVTPPVNDAGQPGDGSTPITTADGGDSSTTPPTEAGTSEAGTGDGGAAPACSSLPGSVVYIESGDTQENLLKALGRQLRDSANITIAFQLTGSCTLAPNLYSSVAIPKGTSMLYIPSTAENATWTTAMPENTCTVTGATPPDLGIAALFPSSCAGIAAPPAGIGSFNGPIQAYTFIVPTASTQTAIWAEEAYYALGDGANNPVTFGGSAEWNDPTQFFLRPSSKSTLVATAKNIDLTATEATLALADGGTSDGRHLEATSTQVLTAVAASTSPQNAIGILGDEVYDPVRATGGVKVLAFKAFGQEHAYLPDSTNTTYDKQNIRDGHYTLWSPTVYIAPVDGSNVPTNPAVKYITDLVLGNQGATPPDGGTAIDGLATVTEAHLTPNCAMQVSRTGDGLPLQPYTPSAPCTCYFLSKVTGATLPTSCVTCSATSACATGTCFNGYCEVPPAGPLDAGADCNTTDDGGASSIINACTNAAAIDKAGVVLPAADGGLLPLNP